MALIFTFSFSFMVLGVVRRVAGAVARSGAFQTRNILPYFFRPVKGVGGRGGGRISHAENAENAERGAYRGLTV
mgnify:FL=1